MGEFEEKDSLQMTCDLEEKLLCELIFEICGENPKRIVEIGTFKGHCTRNLRDTFPKTIIYTIDLFPDSKSDWGYVKDVGQCFEEKRDGIVQIFRKTFEEIPIEAEVWIVDADHRYESCLEDSKLAIKYATHLIVWHDYTNSNYGVRRAVNEATNGRAKILQNSCFAFLKIEGNEMISTKQKKRAKRISYVRKRKKEELPEIKVKKIEPEKIENKVELNKAEISIIVPIHNALAYSLLALESLRIHATNQIQIIPVCDRCESIVMEELKKRKFEPLEADFGDYHKSAMVGFEKVVSPWVMFCNSDMVFGPQWDEPLLRELKAKSKVVASSLQFQRYESMGWSCAFEDPKVGVWTKPNLPFHPQNLDFKWWFNLCNEIKQEYIHRSIPGWHIAQMVLSSKVFDEIGQFNKVVTDGRQEKSMCKKMESLGFSCRVALDSQVFHFVGATMHRYEDNDLSKIGEWWPWNKQ